MVQRFYKIIVAFCLVVYGPAVIAQDIAKKIPAASIITHGPLIKYSIHPIRNVPPIIYFSGMNYLGVPDSVVIKNPAVTGSIDRSYYTQNFGLMCKKELQLQKAIMLPVSLRLGSLEYSNALEKVRARQR